VFEIGISLREARLRQGIELPRVEADTKVRSKYLRALEEERFEVLPAETYVKGFLRTYAEYLGLDGQLYVDEFNSRFARSEEPVLATSAPQRTRSRRMESNFVIVALAGIVAVTILVVVAWRVGSDDTSAPRALIGTQPIGEGPATTSETTTPPASPTPPAAAPQPRLAKLVLSARTGDCWVQVRAGSARGRLIYEGTLQQGQTQRFARWKRLWLELGAPSTLSARLNGRAVDFPQQPSVVVVTAEGVRTIAT
jgi:cytoskeleton protein RodZ